MTVALPALVFSWRGHLFAPIKRVEAWKPLPLVFQCRACHLTMSGSLPMRRVGRCG